MSTDLDNLQAEVTGQPMVSQGVADQEVQAALQSQERLHIMDEEKYQRTIKDLQQQLANGGKIIRTSDKDLAKMNSRIDFDYQTERVPAYELFAPEETKEAMRRGDLTLPAPMMQMVTKFFWPNGVHPDVPDIDPDYLFNPDVLCPILYALEHDLPVYHFGHTGTGKTTLIQQIAARTQQPSLRVNMDSEMTRLDFLGRDTLVSIDGVTASKFVDGVLPQAMQGPYILEADEIDFARSDVLYAFQPVLEDGRTLRITEDGGRVIKADPMFRIVATANTKGQGDEYGCYQGARIQSQAFIDRFQVWVEASYLDHDEEVALITAKVPTCKHSVATKLVRIANHIRDAFTKGEVLTTITPRGLTTVAKMIDVWGQDKAAIKSAIGYTLSGRASDEDIAKMNEAIDAHFGG